MSDATFRLWWRGGTHFEPDNLVLPSITTSADTSLLRSIGACIGPSKWCARQPATGTGER